MALGDRKLRGAFQTILKASTTRTVPPAIGAQVDDFPSATNLRKMQEAYVTYALYIDPVIFEKERKRKPCWH